MKKILRIVIITVIISGLIGSLNEKVMIKSSPVFKCGIVKVGVFLSSYDDPYVVAVKKDLEKIQKENESKVQYEFFNGKRNPDIQNKDLDKLIYKKEVNLILLNLVDQGDTKNVIDKIKEHNIPVIFFGSIDREVIKSYNKAYWIGSDAIEGGVLQGEILIDLWKGNKENIDKNKDNILQYIMLKGLEQDVYAIERTKYSILTTNNAGIKTQELSTVDCKWDEEEAKNATKSLLLRFGKNIEMIIANNDSMAIGAIKALQEYGYNNGDESIKIPVVGFDGVAKARYLIESGVMAGTVIQDPYDSAKALYAVGMNVLHNEDILNDTGYKFGDKGISIILPHKGILTNSYKQKEISRNSQVLKKEFMVE